MASASKVFASVCTYPYQVIKSRLQVQTGTKDAYKGVLITMKSLYSLSGLRGFYKGLFINIIRVLPGTCVTFGVYEGLSGAFGRM